MGIKCFFLEPTDQVQLSLRRYTEPGCHGPGNRMDGHEAIVVLGDAPVLWGAQGDGRTFLGIRPEVVAGDDPRWPAKCDFCAHCFVGFPFHAQLNQDLYYRRTDTGERMLLDDAPVGAQWYADYYPERWRGPDGHSLVCRVPGKHDWIVDCVASNCTKPDDAEHRCWVRHGIPPNVTADKDGNTCSAGAGSILVPGWHGYLRAGELVI